MKKKQKLQSDREKAIGRRQTLDEREGLQLLNLKDEYEKKVLMVKEAFVQESASLQQEIKDLDFKIAAADEEAAAEVARLSTAISAGVSGVVPPSTWSLPPRLCTPSRGWTSSAESSPRKTFHPV